MCAEKKTTLLLQHGNTRPNTSLKTSEHIDKLGWTVLSHLTYSLDLASSELLFAPMKDGLHEEHFVNNTITVDVKQWSPLLVQIFMSMAYRLLFIGGKNA